MAKMNKYTVIDQVLSKSTFQELKILLQAQNFPYYFAPSSDGMDGIPMFCHILVQNNEVNSPAWEPTQEILQPMFKKVKNETGFNVVLRTKINMYLNYGEQKLMGIHTDFPNSDIDYKTAVLNLTTCDGFTALIIEDEEIVIPSKENQLILFDGDIPHYGATSTDTQNRLLINFDFLKENNEDQSSNST